MTGSSPYVRSARPRRESRAKIKQQAIASTASDISTTGRLGPLTSAVASTDGRRATIRARMTADSTTTIDPTNRCCRRASRAARPSRSQYGSLRRLRKGMCIRNTSGPRGQDRLSASAMRDGSAIARLSPSRTGRCTDDDAGAARRAVHPLAAEAGSRADAERRCGRAPDLRDVGVTPVRKYRSPDGTLGQDASFPRRCDRVRGSRPVSAGLEPARRRRRSSCHT
jgi:hypothetical protein